MNAKEASIDGRVWSLREIENEAEPGTPLRIVVDWIASYIIKPHPELGRPGVVCPFVPSAIERNALWFAVIRDVSPSPIAMRNLVQKYMRVYEALEPIAGDGKLLKALILILPEIPQDEACSLVEGVKDTMKLSFIEAGLMLGEFYAASKSPGLHNPDFNPLTSPIPLFVYRQLLPDDLVFLTKQSDSAQLRIRFIRAYLRLLGDKLSPERLHVAHAALRAAELQLSEQRHRV